MSAKDVKAITMIDAQDAAETFEMMMDELLSRTHASDQEERQMIHAAYQSFRTLCEAFEARNKVLDEADRAVRYFRGALEEAVAQRNAAIEELEYLYAMIEDGNDESIYDLLDARDQDDL